MLSGARAVLLSEPISHGSALAADAVERCLHAASVPYRPWRLLAEPLEDGRLEGSVRDGHLHLLVRRHEPWRRSTTRLIAEVRRDGAGSVVDGRTVVRPDVRLIFGAFLLIAVALVVGGVAAMSWPTAAAGVFWGAAVLGQLTWIGAGVQQDRATIDRWLRDELAPAGPATPHRS